MSSMNSPIAAPRDRMSDVSISDQIETFLRKRQSQIMIINLIITAVFSLLMFDVRLSFATDDSTYIDTAWNFLHHGTYPNFHGALYPIFLTFMLWITGGTHLLLFKSCGIVFLVLHNYFFYRALRGRIPYTLLFAALFVGAINAYILAYGSATFSEALYLMVQALAIWAFTSLTDKLENPETTLSNSLKNWILFGLAFFVLSLAKNVAIFSFMGTLVHFGLKKQWKYIIIAIIFFAGIKVPFEIMLKLTQKRPPETQLDQLLRKDYYDPKSPKEDLDGYMDRFYVNYGNYVSVHIFKMLGFRGKGIPQVWTFDKMKEIQDPELKMEPSFFYSALWLGLIILTLYQSFRHNHYILYLTLHTGALLGVTFFALQGFWNQDRLMVVVLPLMVITMLYGIYALAYNKQYDFMKRIVLGICILMLLIETGTTVQAMKQNKAFKGLLKQDKFYAYDPQISSYLHVCDWVSKNYTDTAKIMCSRPVEAGVFGGFGRFSRMPKDIPQTSSPDTLISFLRSKKINYMIIDQGFQGPAQIYEFLQKAAPNRMEILYADESEAPAAFIKLK